jgi:hypothetical protein
MFQVDIELNGYPVQIATVHSHGGNTVKLSCPDLGVAVTPFQLTICGLLEEGYSSYGAAATLGKSATNVGNTIQAMRLRTEDIVGVTESFRLEVTRANLSQLGLLDSIAQVGFNVFAQEILTLY